MFERSSQCDLLCSVYAMVLMCCALSKIASYLVYVVGQSIMGELMVVAFWLVGLSVGC